MSDAITGHVPKNVARTYGPPTLADMAEAMKRFPRYNATCSIDGEGKAVTAATTHRTKSTVRFEVGHSIHPARASKLRTVLSCQAPPRVVRIAGSAAGVHAPPSLRSPNRPLEAALRSLSDGHRWAQALCVMVYT
jgi:hypothetical protein